MAYKHGVATFEQSTAITPAVNTTAGLPVFVGTAPIHLATTAAAANRPILCYSLAEAQAAFGYNENFKDFTLCEAIYSEFQLFNVKPVVLVNVLDPAKHKEAVTKADLALTNGAATLTDAVLLNTLKVKVNEAGQDLVTGTDYEAAYNDSDQVVITALTGGLLASATTCYVTYDKLDPSKVTSADIIGGVDATTNAMTGLETINQVFPLFGLVPGMLLAPKWSKVPEVAAIMRAKAKSINGLFRCSCLTDIPTASDGATTYTAVPEWKSKHSYTGVDESVCWPMAKIGTKILHLSTIEAGLCGQIDADNDDIPYESPSNKSISIEGLCLEDGTEVILGPEQANYLNGQGVVTGLNFNGRWTLWGNRTACYPSDTDPKDSWLCVRRMFNWWEQTFLLTYWQKVDKPIVKRLVENIVDSENIRLNGYTARGYILGGRIEFRSDDNPDTDLIDGIIRFHTYFTPPVPAREIENTLEYDVSNLSSLFSA